MPLGAGVADVVAGDDVNYVLGDIGGMVGDALQIFGHQDQLEGLKDHGGITHHVAQQLAEDLVAQAVHLVVANQHRTGQLDVAVDQCVEAVADHAFREFAHSREVYVGLDARMAQDALGRLGDIDGLVADAFEIVVDARDGQYEAQVSSHQLLQRQQLHHAIVDFDLQLVDGRLFLQNLFGQRSLAIENGMNGLVHSPFGQAAHPQDALLQLVQIALKVPFHGAFSSPPPAIQLGGPAGRPPPDFSPT